MSCRHVELKNCTIKEFHATLLYFPPLHLNSNLISHLHRFKMARHARLDVSDCVSYHVSCNYVKFLICRSANFIIGYFSNFCPFSHSKLPLWLKRVLSTTFFGAIFLYFIVTFYLYSTFCNAHCVKAALQKIMIIVSSCFTVAFNKLELGNNIHFSTIWTIKQLKFAVL